MRIMAVTKTIPVERILPILRERGITLVGESRWQEAKTKLPLLPADVEKHFIGHLQTNKAAEVVQAFDCIETVDSVKLAEAISTAAKHSKKIMSIFLQVNISNDPAKHGFTVTTLDGAVSTVRALSHVRLDGLMTITAKQSKAATRSDFRTMKTLQQQFSLPELSMGMSADWKIAEAEGSTIVRLGTALFGRRA
jgi:pyridoxal phosphate enzyme (YggS family)